MEVIFDNGKNAVSAKAAATKADIVIIVAALTGTDEGELLIDIPAMYGGDRDYLHLPPSQEEMIINIAEVSKKCIVVLEAGSAITMQSWMNDVDGILMAWYPGMEGGNAIAEILFGDFNPCGKLPINWPKSEDQLFESGNHQEQIVYTYYHGYKYFDKHSLEPQFPFGFGLSYTGYEYTNLVLSTNTIPKDGMITISADIKNIGDVKGEEIVQMYVGYNESEVDRPVRDLKGFCKVSLEPGEIKTINMDLNAKDLVYYNVESKTWKTEEIEYSVLIGASSRDILLSDTFSVVN